MRKTKTTMEPPLHVQGRLFAYAEDERFWSYKKCILTQAKNKCLDQEMEKNKYFGRKCKNKRNNTSKNGRNSAK